MSKINCPVCGTEIDRKDTKCITCGSDHATIELELARKSLEEKHLIKKERKYSPTLVAIGLVILIGLIIFMVVVGVPKINEMMHTETVENLKEHCKNNDGIWNEDTNECTYDY